MFKKLFIACSLFLIIGSVGLSNQNFSYKENPVYAETVKTITADEFIIEWAAYRIKYPNICDPAAKADFNQLYEDYISLSKEDKEIVDATPDVDGYTIGDSIKYLINHFKNFEVVKKTKLDKGNTLTIVIALAVFGMTAVCGFFLLKNKNIID